MRAGRGAGRGGRAGCGGGGGQGAPHAQIPVCPQPGAPRRHLCPSGHLCSFEGADSERAGHLTLPRVPLCAHMCVGGFQGEWSAYAQSAYAQRSIPVGRPQGTAGLDSTSLARTLSGWQARQTRTKAGLALDARHTLRCSLGRRRGGGMRCSPRGRRPRACSPAPAWRCTGQATL